MRLVGFCAAAVLLGAAVGCNHSAAAGADAGPGDGGKQGDARAREATAAFAYDAGAADEQIPATTSEELTTRAKHLVEAIGHDNPDLGADMLFPRDGYIAARDVTDPGKVWDRKVVTVWKKTVHRLHKRKGMERAQFVSLELGHAVVQSMPKKREWKKPLWKVKHSKLSFTIDGKTVRIDVAEMTAWHGAWYVTRLR